MTRLEQDHTDVVDSVNEALQTQARDEDIADNLLVQQQVLEEVEVETQQERQASRASAVPNLRLEFKVKIRALPA